MHGQPNGRVSRHVERTGGRVSGCVEEDSGVECRERASLSASRPPCTAASIRLDLVAPPVEAAGMHRVTAEKHSRRRHLCLGESGGGAPAHAAADVSLRWQTSHSGCLRPPTGSAWLFATAALAPAPILRFLTAPPAVARRLASLEPPPSTRAPTGCPPGPMPDPTPRPWWDARRKLRVEWRRLPLPSSPPIASPGEGGTALGSGETEGITPPPPAPLSACSPPTSFWNLHRACGPSSPVSVLPEQPPPGRI